MLGSSFRGQFDIRNRLPLSVFQFLSLVLTSKGVVVSSFAGSYVHLLKGKKGSERGNGSAVL